MASGDKRAGTDLAKLAERVHTLVEQGVGVAEAYASVRGANAKALKEQQRAVAAHTKAVARHERHLTASARRAVTWSTVSVATAVIGVIDVASGTVAGEPVWWLGGAALSAVFAVRASHAGRTATEPGPLVLPVSAPADLRRDATGWAQAQGLIAVRRQVAAMLPAVRSLHPGAGAELAAADGEAGPVLSALVTRLGLLDQVVHELPGTSAAMSAAAASVQVRDRLADGVQRYDALLAAAATMLAAPDMGRSSVAVLGPAADALTAYAHGLASSATTFD